MELKATVNLPKTDFPQKGNLPVREPERLEAWQTSDVYAQIRAAREGRVRYNLHDGPPYAKHNIHFGHVLNKVLKDLVVKVKTMEGFDAPYVPGLGLSRPPRFENQVREKPPEEKEQANPIFRSWEFPKAEPARTPRKYVRVQFKGFSAAGNPPATGSFHF